MGVNKEDMAIAANKLAESGGGMIVVENGKILAHVPMVIAGLMSEQPLETVVEQVRDLEKAWQQLGYSCSFYDIFLDCLTSNPGSENLQQRTCGCNSV